MAVTMVVVVATDLDNNVLPGAKLYSYVAGTTTPRAMYTDSGLGTATANPFVCDASGRGVVWLDSALGDYKLVLKDSGDATTYYSQDNITVGDNPQIIVYPAGVGDQSLNVADAPTFAGLTLTGNLDLDGNDLIIDGDADTYLHANADDDVRLVVAGVDKLTFNTTGLQPTADDGYQLGGASNRFSNVYASAANVDGNLTITGTVDGRDVSADGLALDNLVTTIGLSSLTSGEVDQLENIGATTISNSQWGYLGGSAAFGGSLMATADQAAAQALLNVAVSATFASQAEAEAGTDVTKSMNALRVRQSHDSHVGTATQTQLDLKAPLASPALTGTPTAPAPSAGTNTTQISTTAFVQSEFASYLSPSSSAPATERDGTALAFGDTFVRTAAGAEALNIYFGGFGPVSATVSAGSWGCIGDVAADRLAYDTLAASDANMDTALSAATDDTTALQTAMTKASLRSAWLDLEGRTYKITGDLNLDAAGTGVCRVCNGGIVDANPTRSGGEQRMLKSAASGMRIELFNVWLHRGTDSDAHVPANLTTTSPDTLSHAAVRIAGAASASIIGCDVRGHGVGSGVVVGADRVVVTYNDIHDMEWRAEAATTPATITYLALDDGINAITVIASEELSEVAHNKIWASSVRYDSGAGEASYFARTRGVVYSAGAGGGIGNRNAHVHHNWVSRVGQGYDFTGGSATGSNQGFNVHDNRAEHCYGSAFKGANTFIDGWFEKNVAYRCGLFPFVFNSSVAEEVPVSLQTRNVTLLNNKVIDQGVYDYAVPLDHYSGNGWNKTDNTMVPLSILQGSAANAQYFPHSVLCIGMEIENSQGKLDAFAYSNVDHNPIVQTRPNCMAETVYSGDTTLDNVSNLYLGRINPKVIVYLETSVSIAQGAFTDLDWDTALQNDFAMWNIADPEQVLLPWAGEYKILLFTRSGSSTDAGPIAVQSVLQIDRTGSSGYESVIGSFAGSFATNAAFVASAAYQVRYQGRVGAGGKLKARVGHNDSASLSFLGSSLAPGLDHAGCIMTVEYLPRLPGGVSFINRPS